MSKRIFILVAILSIFLGAVCSGGIATIDMPSGFTDIYPHMKLKDFLVARKDAKAFGFFKDGQIDKDEPNQMLFETLENHQYFDHALYKFEDSDLEMVVLASKRKKEKEQIKREDIVIDLIKKWGTPTSILVTILEGDIKAPALIWKKEDSIMALSISPDDDKNLTPNIIELKISFKRNTQIKDLFNLASVTKAEEKQIIAPLQSIVESLSN